VIRLRRIHEDLGTVWASGLVTCHGSAAARARAVVRAPATGSRGRWSWRRRLLFAPTRVLGPSDGRGHEAEESVRDGEHAADGEDRQEGNKGDREQPYDQSPEKDHGVNDLGR
jgi:hypothetical protein